MRWLQSLQQPVVTPAAKPDLDGGASQGLHRERRSAEQRVLPNNTVLTNRTDRAAAGFVTSVIQLSIVAVLQIALVPVIMRKAGHETLGAYAALTQMLLMLSLMDLGFGL